MPSILITDVDGVNEARAYYEVGISHSEMIRRVVKREIICTLKCTSRRLIQEDMNVSPLFTGVSIAWACRSRVVPLHRQSALMR